MLSHVQLLSIFVESSGGISHDCKFYPKLSEADDPICKLHWEFSFSSGFYLILLAIPLFPFRAYQRKFNFSFFYFIYPLFNLFQIMWNIPNVLKNFLFLTLGALQSFLFSQLYSTHLPQHSIHPLF